MWRNKFKIALVQQDTEAINMLLDSTPQFDETHDRDEILEVMYLLREASILLHTLEDQTRSSMRQIKNNLSFLQSTQQNSTNRLNLFS